MPNSFIKPNYHIKKIFMVLEIKINFIHCSNHKKFKKLIKTIKPFTIFLLIYNKLLFFIMLISTTLICYLESHIIFKFQFNYLINLL